MDVVSGTDTEGDLVEGSPVEACGMQAPSMTSKAPAEPVRAGIPNGTTTHGALLNAPRWGPFRAQGFEIPFRRDAP